MIFPSVFIWEDFWGSSFREEKDGVPLHSLLWGFSWTLGSQSLFCSVYCFYSFFNTLPGHVLQTWGPQKQGWQNLIYISFCAGLSYLRLLNEFNFCYSKYSAVKVEQWSWNPPLSYSLSSCGTAKHISRHFFVLCLKNTALTRGKWSL